MPAQEMKTQEVRASAALTSAYVAGTVVVCDGWATAFLFMTYTRNASSSGNTFSGKVEFSWDGGTTYYQQTVLSQGAVTAGSDATNTLQRCEFSYNDTSSSAEYIVYAVPTLGATHLKFSFKETGDTTNLPTLAATCGLVR